MFMLKFAQLNETLVTLSDQ